MLLWMVSVGLKKGWFLKLGYITECPYVGLLKLQLLVSTKQTFLVTEVFLWRPTNALFFCIQLFWDELCHLKPIRLIDCVCAMVNGSVGLVPLFINIFNLPERFTHLFIFHPGGWLRFIVAGDTIWLNYPKATGSSPVFYKKTTLVESAGVGRNTVLWKTTDAENAFSVWLNVKRFMRNSRCVWLTTFPANNSEPCLFTVHLNNS